MYAALTQICTVPVIGGGSTSLSYTLDSASKKFAISFQPSESLTLAKVAFKVASKTGSPTCSIRIETDDGSGRPSGSLAWANATITGVAISAAGWLSEQTLTASGTVSPGTIYHVVIANDAATPASNYFAPNDQGATSGLIDYSIRQYLTALTASYNGSAWANRYGPIFMLSDSGGTTKFGQPFEDTGIQTMSNTTAYGVKFTAPLSGSVVGVTLAGLPNTGVGDVTAKLYDGSDNLLGTATFKTGLGTILGSGRVLRWFPFDSGAVSITSGSTYRLVFNDSGSADRLEYVTAPSSPDYRQIAPFAQDMQWTQGTTGSWTDTPGKLPVLFSLTVSSVTSGGGGGTVYPIVIGG